MSYTKCTIQEGGSSIHVPFKISYTAICTVLTAEFNNYHTSSGVQLSPLVCSLLMGSFSVCEKLDVVHQVYDPRLGLKYTCTLQISYTAICTVRTAEFNNYHTSSGCTTKPFGLQSVDGLL